MDFSLQGSKGLLGGIAQSSGVQQELAAEVGKAFVALFLRYGFGSARNERSSSLSGDEKSLPLQLRVGSGYGIRIDLQIRSHLSDGGELVSIG